MAKYSCFEEYRKKRYQTYNRKYYSEWYRKNKKKRKLYWKKYWDIPENRKRRIERKKARINIEKEKYFQKEWYRNNKEKRRQYRRTKRQTDIKFVLDGNIGSAIWEALKERKNGRKWENLVGYTVESLMKHLERQFDDKMSWNNYGSYWWIDHIKPKSLFKYKTPKDEEFKECWALSNLQPMEKITNMRKGKSFPYILLGGKVGISKLR